MKLVCIPPGEFMMGSPSDELLRKSNEGPQHRVRITNDFYIGSTEVTQAQYAAIMETNPSHFKGEDNPVETVSWNNAVEFCRKLSEMEGKKYRLPTEAEWEYACRAGTTTPFYTGETIDTSQANYNGREVYGNGTKGVFRRGTIAVGGFPPNAFGLYDMHGNVWEWCQDWYASNYYSTSPATDPQGPSTGDHRVLRGGCWIVYPRSCRSTVRDWNTPVNRLSSNGFRILLELN
jgi:formylglycine-generating enzyme required for sulfatase activity